MSDDEKLPILGSASSLGPVASTNGTDPDQVETKVYRRRWWVLGVFVLTSCAQVHTVLPANSDSDVMFCLQSYQRLMIDRSLVN